MEITGRAEFWENNKSKHIKNREENGERYDAIHFQNNAYFVEIPTSNRYIT